METCGSGRKAKGESHKSEFLPFAHVLPGISLEGEAQPQANGPAIVNALIRVALYELPEIRVGIDLRNRQELPGSLVDFQEERTDVSKIERGVRVCGRAQGVVEDIVEICPHLEP